MLEGLFHTTVTTRPVTLDADQAPTLGARTVHEARVQTKMERVRKEDGDEITSRFVVYTPTPINTKQLMFLSGEDDTDVKAGHEILIAASSPSLDGDETLYKTWIL